MTMIKTTIGFLPNLFPGFYESSLSGVIDTAEESELEYISEILINDYNVIANNIWDIPLDIDYVEAKKLISKEYIQAFLHFTKDEIDYNLVCKLDSIKFKELISPRYYNFQTDEIDIDIELDPEALTDYAVNNLDSFKFYLKDNFESRDGFHSFYSTDWDEWLDGTILNKNSCIFYTYMFNFFVENSVYVYSSMEEIDGKVIDSLYMDINMNEFISYDIDDLAKKFTEHSHGVI